MRKDVVALFEEIKRCTGIDGCWGYKNPRCRKPVILPCKQHPKFMVISEQMNLREKEWKRKPENIPENWDSSKEMLNLIRDTKERGRRIGIIPKIDELFDGKFLEDFDTGSMSFNEFYWTHFIKCPGNLRNRSFEHRGLVLNVCADTFLLKEIQILRPEVIVCLGEYASTWILRKTGYDRKWTDMLWEEIEWVISREKYIPERRIGYDHKAKIIVMPHPSGKNPWATVLNKKLKYLLSLC